MMDTGSVNVLDFAKRLRAEHHEDVDVAWQYELAAHIIEDLQGRLAKEFDSVANLVEDRDQHSFIFTARLQALVAEFEGKISTAAAIGAFEVVKHELIAEALESE